ncbi:MAG: hypothetical protein HC859_06555 [Bacteroidia bacterium]|nr:hypothetical protein [Bacteroidia bacterium]
MSKRNSQPPAKAADEIIQDLILRRKQQQEALIKIKASMEKKHSADGEATGKAHSTEKRKSKS